MHPKTRTALLGYGLSSELIDKIGNNDHTIGLLRAMSREKLLERYSTEEVDQITNRINRTPIPEETIEQLKKQAADSCCYCADGNSSIPYQIHHIDPYSETQDNSIGNLLLICPTHHSVVHANNVDRDKQRSEKRRWQSIVKIAASYIEKGLQFPYGIINALDYSNEPKLSELVEFAPLSPSTALASAPTVLANAAHERLEAKSFLLVHGVSGSGKSTFAMAIAGMYAKQGYIIYRLNATKQDHNLLSVLSVFVSICVKPTVIILDDINTWATSQEVDQIAKMVLTGTPLRVIATWTLDNSEDSDRINFGDLPRYHLTWQDLRPAVIETMLQNEAIIVEALKGFETTRRRPSIGVGQMDESLETRIRILGEKPKSVFEFIFGLRDNYTTVADELKQLIADARADVPVVHVAIEQIAGFEGSTTEENTHNSCERVKPQRALPPASRSWIQKTLEQQVNRRRLVKIRDHYSTIHRKWAAHFIAASLINPDSYPTTAALLAPDFNVQSATPARLLRLWNWLSSIEEVSPFIQKWQSTLSVNNLTLLVERCANAGLMEIGILSQQIHLLYKEQIVAEAFERNKEAIANLVYTAKPTDWYFLNQISMVMRHACSPVWVSILDNWDKNNLANLIANTALADSDHISWVFANLEELNPNWLQEVGLLVPWINYRERIFTAQTGDVRSISDALSLFVKLTKKLKRSMCRDVINAIGKCLKSATLEDLDFPVMDSYLILASQIFSEDFKRVFDGLDVKQLATKIEHSVPRQWRTLTILNMYASMSRSPVCCQIIQHCDVEKLGKLIEQFWKDNRYELRCLLHFLSATTKSKRTELAVRLENVVREACAAKDSEAESIIAAFRRLHPRIGARLAVELSLQDHKSTTRTTAVSLKQYRTRVQAMDLSGEDYDLFPVETTEQGEDGESVSGN